VTGDDALTLQRRRPVRAVLDIADRALRADIADACDDAGIAVAERGEAAGAADVVLIDRPMATALPAIAIVSGAARRAWPANVCAVVPADADAATLAAVITVVAAGYAVTPRGDAAARGDPDGDPDRDDEDAGEDATEGGGRPAGEPGPALSSREREVLALLAGGASNKEIALALAVSVSTVKFHVAAIMEKLGARSRVDAVAIAIRAGLVMV
jgi:DNA-binding NarL/FixJ family response regulator